jgi:hypothetical protein
MHPGVVTWMQYTIPPEREKWKKNLIKPANFAVHDEREFKQAHFAEGNVTPQIWM